MYLNVPAQWTTLPSDPDFPDGARPSPTGWATGYAYMSPGLTSPLHRFPMYFYFGSVEGMPPGSPKVFATISW